MKVFAANTVSNGGDHKLYVALHEDAIAEQIVEDLKFEYGEAENDDYYQENKDEYLSYDNYLLEKIYISAEGAFDL